MKRKKRLSKNEALALYKTYVPVVSEKIHHWDTDNEGKVTLFVENKGIMNSIMQKIAKKPKVSQIHLDETGSFIWQRIDGMTNIETIAEAVEEHFGENAHPLYERLLKFFEIVESYDFILWKKPV
ncbi:MAG: PqqD family protein [Lachnospiraceae bacterium]|nr:PqqD family protein [Lachnospiraceae bacterium]MBQ5430956.1 PqqD family protein [Lachnospiraceae bacterium]